MRRYILASLATCSLLVPSLAFAQALTRITSIFNVFVGIMLTAAILAYGIGFVIWVTRLGTWPTYRTEGIKVAEWAVAIMFTLFVILAIVHYFQTHPAEATGITALVVILLVIWMIVFLTKNAKKDAKKEEPPRR